MAGVDAFGTTWGIDAAGGTTYVAVADVTKIGVLDISVDTIEVTSNDSAGQWREFITGLKDGGELSMEVNYDPGNHDDIFAIVGVDGVTHELGLADDGAADVTFTAVLTGLSVDAPHDDKMVATVTLKLSGAPVITP